MLYIDIIFFAWNEKKNGEMFAQSQNVHIYMLSGSSHKIKV